MHCVADEAGVVEEVPVPGELVISRSGLSRTYICVNIAALGEPVVPEQRVSQGSSSEPEKRIPDVNCRFSTSSGLTKLSA